MYIAIGLAVVVGLFVIIVAIQPTAFVIHRSAKIAAPPAVVFDNVNELRRWAEWSPWEAMEPDIQKTFDGPPTGAGSSQHWVGRKTGEGIMTITDSRPNERIELRLDFKKPMKATNTAEFIFKPEGDGTAVTWSMSGQRNFMMKAFGLFMNFDKMVGGQFDQGLAKLKSISEAQG